MEQLWYRGLCCAGILSGNLIMADIQKQANHYYELIHQGVSPAEAYKQAFPDGIPTAQDRAKADAKAKQKSGLGGAAGLVTGAVATKYLMDKVPVWLGSGSSAGAAGTTAATGASAAGGAAAGGTAAGTGVTVATPNIISAGVVPEVGASAATSSGGAAAGQAGLGTYAGIAGATYFIGKNIYDQLTKKRWLRPYDRDQALTSKKLNDQLPGYADLSPEQRGALVDYLKESKLLKSSGVPNYMMDAKFKPEDEEVATSYRVQMPEYRSAGITYARANEGKDFENPSRPGSLSSIAAMPRRTLREEYDALSGNPYLSWEAKQNIQDRIGLFENMTTKAPSPLATALGAKPSPIQAMPRPTPGQMVKAPDGVNMIDPSTGMQTLIGAAQPMPRPTPGTLPGAWRPGSGVQSPTGEVTPEFNDLVYRYPPGQGPDMSGIPPLVQALGPQRSRTSSPGIGKNGRRISY